MNIKRIETHKEKRILTLTESDVEAIIVKDLIARGHLDADSEVSIELQCRENYFDQCFVSQEINLLK